MLYVAETQSILGDQLARVSLSILVFDRTGSASATALVYALTYLPAIVGGIVLGGIGDRFPRRIVMVVTDLVRAGLFAAMAVPQVPLPALMALLAVAVFLGPAFVSAEVSYLASRLSPAAFRAGTGLRMISGQLAQVAGFALGGVAVAALGARSALLVDAATFALSACLVLSAPAAARRGRHVAARRATQRPRGPASARGAAHRAPGEAAEPPPEKVSIRTVLAIPRVAPLLALSALAGVFIIPEGLAVPFAAGVGAGSFETGLLLAAIPLGGAVGAFVLIRLVPATGRETAAGLMAIGCGLPLIPTVAISSWQLAAGCWFLSGLLAAYQIEVLSALMRATPDAARSRLVGVGSSILLGAQGVGLILAGLLADAAGSGETVAVAGGVGALGALVLALRAFRWSDAALPDEAEPRAEAAYISSE